MADLPDIDTTQVSYLAYWNAIDQGGVNSIDPEEVTSDPNVKSYATYDNGIEGTYHLPMGTETGDDVFDYWRPATFRVKSDGWFVVYLDRTFDRQQGVTWSEGSDFVTPPDRLESPGDLAHHWNETFESNPVENNSLERAINAMQAELSNSDGISYAAADVGLYNYEYTGATTVTLMYAEQENTGDTQAEFTYSSGTDVKQLAIAGLVSTNGGAFFTGSDGTEYTLAEFSSGDTVGMGCEDGVAAGWVDTDSYTYEARCNSGHDYSHIFAQISIVAAWS